jgi:hypothetical protein
MKTAFFLTVLGLAASAAANPLTGKQKPTPCTRNVERPYPTHTTNKNKRARLCRCCDYRVPDWLQVRCQQLLLVNLRREPELQQRLLQLALQLLRHLLLHEVQDLLKWLDVRWIKSTTVADWIAGFRIS